MLPSCDANYPYPFVKWAGGKRGLLPQLQKLMPDDVSPGYEGRLVEPFVGGGAMFFYLKPRQAVLADMNEDLINLYIQVRDGLSGLLAILDEMGSRPYVKETYYEVRAAEPTDPVEKAARFVFLNRWGWNGLYRVNKKGRFNVPFGTSTSGEPPTLYNKQNMEAASRLLERAELVVATFAETMQRVEAGDFAYLDPPYHPLSATSSFTSYTKLAFGLEDQAKLRESILEAEARTEGSARIMLSNSVAPDLVELYERQNNLRLHTVLASRSISAKASSRGGQPELVVTNY